MICGYIEEPQLEFGNGNHVDIRRGITDLGPFDLREKRRPDRIKIGFVGTAQSISDARNWMQNLIKGVPRKESRKPNLFPDFPGFQPSIGFHSELILDTGLDRELSIREIVSSTSTSDYTKRIEKLAEILSEACKQVHEKGADIVIVSYPVEIFPLLEKEDSKDSEEELSWRERKRKDLSKPDLHDMLKCNCMRNKVPIQVIRPSTYDSKQKRKETDTRGKSKQLQDEATRAWNFLIALYYKAGGIPWRMPRDDDALATFYLGIGFYRSTDNESIHTSIAQVFNERGYGVIVRGGQAKRSNTDKQVHLSKDHIRELVVNALKAYRNEHHHAPARIVLHKTSSFNDEEIDGALLAAEDLHIDLIDMLSLSDSFIRLYRDGYYPPLRGTYIDLDVKRRLLYTKGTIPFYEEYPGMYVPRTLQIQFDHISSSKEELCTSILRLTKMNWNNSQMCESLPITIKAARQVGSILKYASEGEIAEHYKYYM